MAKLPPSHSKLTPKEPNQNLTFIMDFRNRETSHETFHHSALGISFQPAPDQHVFIPYAWLLQIEMTSNTVLVFGFSHAEVAVHGTNLEHIYEAAITAKLAKIMIRATAPSAGKNWVQQIIIKSSNDRDSLQNEFRL